LIYGVSVLCEGSEQDKAELVFKAIDLDSNGLISKDELLNYLGSLLPLFHSHCGHGTLVQ
jgi:Ca2+-binding EF-hand superfamily protein